MPPTDPIQQVVTVLAQVATTFFDAWRRVITAALSSLRGAAGAIRGRALRWAGQWKSIAQRLTRAGGPVSHADERQTQAAAAFGLRAFVFGMLAGSTVVLVAGGAVRTAVAAVIVQTLWAAGRFAVCAALLPSDKLSTGRLAAAYLIGLAPYALAVTGPLTLVALGLSALVTDRELRRAGAEARDVRTAIAWAFGGQAGVMLLGVLARGGLAVLTGI
jgi:hypothetical protein